MAQEEKYPIPSITQELKSCKTLVTRVWERNGGYGQTGVIHEYSWIGRITGNFPKYHRLPMVGNN